MINVSGIVVIIPLKSVLTDFYYQSCQTKFTIHLLAKPKLIKLSNHHRSVCEVSNLHLSEYLKGQEHEKLSLK